MKLIVLFFLLNSLFSLPRFSLEESSSCMSCHINPTGGSMRNDYGSNVYTLDELTIRKWIPKGDINQTLDLVVVRNSNFTRYGNETIRTGSNIHSTEAPDSWNNTEFLTYITDSINQ